MGGTGSLLGSAHGGREYQGCFVTRDMALVKAGSAVHVFRLDADVVDTDKLKPVAIVHFSGVIRCFTCHEHLIFADVGKMVEARSVRSGMLFNRYEGDNVTCMQVFQGDLFAGSEDCSARRWSVETGEVLTKYEGHKDWVTCLQVVNGELFTGSDDKTARRWSVESGQKLRKYEAHEGTVRCLQVANGNLFTGSDDSTVRRWNLETGEELKKYEDVNVIDGP